MNIKQEKFTIAAIVARFQVDKLTEAHKELIEVALKEHSQVLIYLGLSPVKCTINNPLAFQPRKQMILEEFPADKYPNISIFYINDMASNEAWSKKLDESIQTHVGPNDSVVLYGGRESFLTQYCGKLPTRELVSQKYISGSEIRKRLSSVPQSDPLFRAGVVWSAFQRYPSVFPTVDIVVYRAKENKILLAKKPDETNYRFVGGFVSPTDDSYEDAALRELGEETGLSVGLDSLHYIGSSKIDDWRYRTETDKVITHFYFALYTFGCATPNDDVSELIWANLEDVETKKHGQPIHLVPEHLPLFEMLKKYMDKNNLGFQKPAIT